MRRRFAISLKTAVSAILALVVGVIAAQVQAEARLSSVLDIPRSTEWVGGISGIDLSDDGKDVVMITDRGMTAKGRIIRQSGKMERFEITEAVPLANRFGGPLQKAFADAEGLAVHPDGRIFVSFETQDRVSVYQRFGGKERLTGFTTEWRRFPKNQGLEALALAPDGALWAIPEFVWDAGTEGRVYRLAPDGDWQHHETIPAKDGLRPVGADFGPDGQLYLLERGFFALGFYSRVRRFTLDANAIVKTETILETISGRHGNLEGIAVWRDTDGKTVLTMVSDDNFQSVQRNQIVEYKLGTGVAPRID